MPIKNHFPIFHKLKQGAYSYVWTDKCEKMLPLHYKERCLDYMMADPKPVHWIPDPREYYRNKDGEVLRVQNHPIYVKYPIQCNRGLWGGEGCVQCFVKPVTGKAAVDRIVSRVAKFYAPVLFKRRVYSEILDKWFEIPCTNRALDLIDEAFGLDYYILQTHERDLNSKLAMDLRRKMLIKLVEDDQQDLSPERQKIVNRYRKFMIPLHEAEWVGLSIKEALEKAEGLKQKRVTGSVRPVKEVLAEKYRRMYRAKKANEPPEDYNETGGGRNRLKEAGEGIKSLFSGER